VHTRTSAVLAALTTTVGSPLGAFLEDPHQAPRSDVPGTPPSPPEDAPGASPIRELSLLPRRRPLSGRAIPVPMRNAWRTRPNVVGGPPAYTQGRTMIGRVTNEAKNYLATTSAGLPEGRGGVRSVKLALE
jgi:hypothetical protein